jgi:hypothetical protein
VAASWKQFSIARSNAALDRGRLLEMNAANFPARWRI